MNPTLCLALVALVLVSQRPALNGADAASGRSVRIGATQPRSHLIPWRLSPASALDRVEHHLAELEKLVHKAGAAGCDVVVFPEDTLGLGTWEAANKARLAEVLPQATRRMLERLGQAAASYQMYLVCSTDVLDSDAAVRNTAFFLGRDGREIGRYYKVNMPIHELDKKRGEQFPVFPTSDLGDVGMLICYDLVFPEAPRCLALAGADIIFHPTLGGAAIGDDEISRAAFRTRAVENFVYLVVSQRGKGSMIISPKGKILAEGSEPDEIVIADIDPFGGRDGGDAMNYQADMRARLFRERSPAAFRLLTDPNPPVLQQIPETISITEAVRVSAATLTTGEEQFKQADALVRQGRTNEAVTAFQRLRREYPQSWIDRVAAKRIAALQPDRPEPPPDRHRHGIASVYPGDQGIERDPRVLFAENFEHGTIDQLSRRWEHVSNKQQKALAWSSDVPPASSGRRSLQMTADLSSNTGGHLYTRLAREAETAFARFYVKFPMNSGYIHHFVTLGGYHPSTAWPQGGAGERPLGNDRITVGIEPFGDRGRVPPPGLWNFYVYWHEMKASAGGKFWGNSLRAAEPILVPRDRWQCVEMMIQLNSRPGLYDGALALWLDGEPVAEFVPGARRDRWTGLGFSLTEQDGEPFEGFQWRTSTDLMINFLWLLHYVTEQSARQNRATDSDADHRVWFDDIVVATEYIGPISGR